MQNRTTQGGRWQLAGELAKHMGVGDLYGLNQQQLDMAKFHTRVLTCFGRWNEHIHTCMNLCLVVNSNLQERGNDRKEART